MPASKERAKGRFSRVPRLSGRGLSFFFLSAILTLLGVLRIDLSLLFWGGAFLFLSIFFLIGNAIDSARLSRYLASAPDALSVAFRAAGQPVAYPGHEIGFSIQAKLPFLPFPGISIEAERTYASPNGRSTRIALRLGLGETRREVKRDAGGRGRYLSPAEGFKVGDILRFTENFVGKESADEFFIYPDRIDPPGDIDSRRGGESRNVSAAFERSEDLFDSRQYVAGDDTRRLDWKRFARFGDIFVRIGEFSPPPDSAYLVTVLGERPSLLSESDQAAYLDLLASRCAAFLRWAESRGRAAKFLMSEGGGAGLSETAKAEEAERLLAGIAWLPGSMSQAPLLEGDFRRGTRLVAFSAPDCKGAWALAGEATRKGLSPIFLIQGLPPTPLRKAWSWRNLLFLDSGEDSGAIRRGGGRKSSSYRSSFAALAEADIAKYRGMDGTDAYLI